MSNPTSTAKRRDEPHLAAPDLNPSFTKGVFLGEIREDIVFPFPVMSAEESESLRMILDAFRTFATEHVDSAKMDHDGKFPDEVRHGLHELGLMGLNIPEEYGGFGASAKVFNRVFGEIGGTDPALAVYFGAHESIGCKGITLFGTNEQRNTFAPDRLVRAEVNSQCWVGASDLAEDSIEHLGRCAEAAVLLGDVESHEAQLVQSVPNFVRELAVVVHLRRIDMLRGECPERVEDHSE